MTSSHFSEILNSCLELLLTDTSQYFSLSSPDILEANIFAKDLLEILPFNEENRAVIEEYETKNIKQTLEQNREKECLIFLAKSDTWNYEYIESLVREHTIDAKIIFTKSSLEDIPGITTFPIPRISFRDYAHDAGFDLSTPSLLKNPPNHDKLASIFEDYIRNGAYYHNHIHPEGIPGFFHEKISIINEELFEKEHEIFLEFIRTLAMNVGELFKADSLAKILNISRRKVHKYTELLLKHHMIIGIGPFIEDQSTELSRHVKIYFSDLSYYHGALGITYFIGSTKRPIIENFVFLELIKKLGNTHELRFWRKKSGTEIQFILINKENKKLTPIEITIRPSKVISKAMKSFYDGYKDRIEYGMLLNESFIGVQNYEDNTFLTIPYAAI